MGLTPQPRVEVRDPVDGQVGGQTEGDHHRRRPCPHHRDVDEVLSGSLRPDVLSGGPVATEVPALDEHVGGHHDAGLGDRDDGCVVTDPDVHTTRGVPLQGSVDPRDQAELPHVTDQFAAVTHRSSTLAPS